MQRLPWLFRVRSNEKVICGVIGFAIFTDLFLYGLVVPILPYALTPRFGIPETKVQSSTSTLLAVYAAGLLVSCPFVGWFADWTTSRRLPLLLGLFALVGSTLIFTLGRSFSLLVVARVLQGISAAVVWTVGLALLVDTVGMDRLGVAMGVVSIFMSVGIALGPVLGGIIYEVGGYYAPFYLAFA
ncbi:MAG: MFS transporter, partial [Oxalobacteraceae bacterium]